VLCTQESDRTLKLFYGRGRPRFEYTYRPQRVLYFYLNDPQTGRMFVRIQTWFPWKIQVYVNGTTGSPGSCTSTGISYEQRDNAFLSIADPQAAQRLADRFTDLPWANILNWFARTFNPLLSHPGSRGGCTPGSSTRRNTAPTCCLTTGPFCPVCIHGCSIMPWSVFSAQDVLAFLGRRLHPLFEGEVLSSCQKKRWPGARIKHRVGNNC